MSDNNISLDPDQAAASVTKLADSQEAATTVSAQVEGHGTWVGPGYGFRFDLGSYVKDIQDKMAELRLGLGELEEAITKTVIEMGEQDEALAGDAAQFTTAVTVAAAGNSASDLAAAFTPTTSTKQSTPGSGGVTW